MGYPCIHAFILVTTARVSSPSGCLRGLTHKSRCGHFAATCVGCEPFSSCVSGRKVVANLLAAIVTLRPVCLVSAATSHVVTLNLPSMDPSRRQGQQDHSKRGRLHREFDSMLGASQKYQYCSRSSMVPQYLPSKRLSHMPVPAVYASSRCKKIFSLNSAASF